MAAPNRIKAKSERFELSLDVRQVAAVVTGALVLLGAVFVLGLSVGRQVTTRQPPPPERPADPLAALDAPVPRAGAEPAPKLSYHETLTKDRPPAPEPARPAAPPEPPRPAPAAAPPAPAPAPAPAAAESGPAPAEAKPPTREEPKPTVREEPKAPAPEGTFTIQVGSVRDAAQARRIVERYKSHRARIVTADIPGKGRWYRVRVGSFDSRAAAERYLKDMQRDMGAGGIVTPAN
jgi:cell division septation protein DedD